MNAVPEGPFSRRLVHYSLASSDFLVRIVRGLVWPKVELLIRLWLAKIFFASGLLKIMHWQAALELAAHEYPVSFMSPVAAASVGAGIEVFGAVLLALGFITRYAAAFLLAVTLVIQSADRGSDSQLFWAVLFGWYVVNGAGPISVDSLLRRGLAASALPWVPGILRFSARVRIDAGPWYLTFVRMWLAATLAALALHSQSTSRLPITVEKWLPLTVASLPMGAVVIAAVLALGIGTRYAAAAAMLMMFADAMMDPRQTDAVYVLMILSILIVYGAGSLSLDGLLSSLVKSRAAKSSARHLRHLENAPRVVIVGAGFGGMSCAGALRTARVSVTLIDRQNYHLFQPLLYQVATAALSPGDIAAPVRAAFRNARNVRVMLGEVTGIDARRKLVSVDGKAVPYDYLVLATGATHSYFGKDGWAPFAPGLKRIEDAVEIRRRILTAFERAESAEDAAERAALLTFVIVGGGPTGVELAGAIAELARYGMDNDFRNFDPARARVVVVQSASRLLPAFPEALAAIAQRALEKLGVEVCLNSRADDIDVHGIAFNGMRIEARTVLWAAGVTASAAAKWLGAPADRAGRILVGPDLGVPGMTAVFAIGDTAMCDAWRGQAVPGLAPAAKQGGIYVARLIRARIEARAAPGAFKYRHLGSLATIGRKAAVADFGFVRLWGGPAWWLWGLLHVGFLLGARNRVATMLNWFWAYLTLRGGIRLITGHPGTPPAQ